MPLLITSAIRVSAAYTKLADFDSRLALTLEGIQRWLASPGIGPVVVCDGSGVDLGAHATRTLSNGGALTCEYLSFQNDTNAVRANGKGFGEGEIVNYALEHSQVLRAASKFAKCTGKLWVENHASCISHFNGIAAFNILGHFQAIDTRFYIVDKSFYLNRLATAYRDVRDGDGFYLEHAFKKALSTLKPSEFVMFPTPRLTGISGSTGTVYNSGGPKGFLRDARSLMIKCRLIR